MTQNHRSGPAGISRRGFLGGVAGAGAVTAFGLLSAEAANAEGTAGIASTSAATSAQAGARTPFVTLGAQTGVLGGGARVLALTPGMPVGTSATLASEASGNALVELQNVGDSVTLRNTTSIHANTIVVRAAIPDAPTGGGIEATLDLYVDGTFRQALSLSSAQAWLYLGSAANPKDPAGGRPYRFYNDFPFWIDGAPIHPGQRVTLRKGTGNTAAWYAIDCIDLEAAPEPLTQPAGALNVLDYGADPTFTTDSTLAIQTAVNAARTRAKTVFIPAGKYLTASLAPDQLDFTGVRVQGAGMWHTIIYRKPPLPSSNTWRNQILVGSGTHLSDIQTDSHALYRGLNRAGGADYSFQCTGSGGWIVERVWVRHCDAAWMSGTGGLVQDCRSSDSYGDGFNVNNSNSPNPEKLGNNMIVRNNYVRGSGDDSFAVYSDGGAESKSAQIDNVQVLNNTAAAPYWANGLRIAGGRNIVFRGNRVDNVSSNYAMDIGVFGDTGLPLESATVEDNLLIGGGGWNSVRHGVRVSSPAATSLFAGAPTVVTLRNNVLRDSLNAGLFIDIFTDKVVFDHNSIERPAAQGILIRTNVSGTGAFTRNQVKGLRAGQPAFQNQSPDTFVVTQRGNSWPTV